MKCSFVVILVCALIFPSRVRAESDAEESLKRLLQQGEASVTRSHETATVPAPAGEKRTEIPPASSTLSQLVREVEDLKSRVVVTEQTSYATQRPQTSRALGSKTYYNYKEGAVYEVHCGVDKLTDVELQAGEKLTNAPVSGDTVRWKIGVIQSGKKGEEVNHIVIKPLEESIETNVIVTTTRRIYHLRATASDWYMPALAWHYPDDEAEAMRVKIEKEEQEVGLSLSPEQIDFDYELSGFEYLWKPIRVFDDGSKTYLQMPKAMRVTEAPVLFELHQDNPPRIINYRVKGDYYIIDGLINRAELRVGKDDAVTIYSKRGPRSFWERIF